MSGCKLIRACAMGLGFTVLGFGSAAQGAFDPQALVFRYQESLRKATEENDLTGATNEVDSALAEFRDLDPQNPQLAALHLLRGVLMYAVDGEGAREDILDSFKAALRLHPWAQFEPSMRSQALDALLDEARGQVSVPTSDDGVASGISVPRCGEGLSVYTAFDAELGVASATLHLLPEGGSEFEEYAMELFAGVAAVELGVEDHEDQDAAYYLTLNDASGDVVTSIGTEQSPQRLGLRCAQAESPKLPRAPLSKKRTNEQTSHRPGASRFRRIGFRLAAGTGWGISYGKSQRVYDIANPQEKEHYSVLATACAIARRAAPRGGPLPSPQQLFGGNANAPTADSIFGQVATPEQAKALAGVYSVERCSQRHAIDAGVASSMFHIEPELSVRVNKLWELAVFSRLQIVHGLNILVPVEGAGLTEINPAFERLKLPMPWTVGFAARYRKQVAAVKGLSWFVGGYAGYGQAALAVPMRFGHDRNGNSVADENEAGCSVGPNPAPVFPAMDGCTDPTKSAKDIETLRAMAKDAGKARDVLVLGKVFAGVEFGVEYLFTPVIGLSVSGQVGAWFAGHRSSGLLDLKLGPTLHF